jgi:hypothetical protein
MSDSEEEPSRLPLHLPPGVGCVVQCPDGSTVLHLDPFLRDMRWPDVRADSAAFKNLAAHDRLYQQAQAFLRAALVLCERAGESGPALDWPQASVCYYCLHLATELFLKACILHVGGEPAKSHEIGDLLKLYAKLLPGEEDRFPTPWGVSASELDHAFGVKVLSGIDRTPDQLYRYGMDKGGAASSGIQFFTPGYFFNYAEYLTVKWSEVWSNAASRDDG